MKGKSKTLLHQLASPDSTVAKYPELESQICGLTIRCQLATPKPSIAQRTLTQLER